MIRAIAISIFALALGGSSLCKAEPGYVPGQPSFDCTKARNTVAIILCSGPEAAQADWEYNASSWAYYFTLNDGGRSRMSDDQRAWRQSLDRICALPRWLTPEEQAAQQAARELGWMFLGPQAVIPGPQPINQAHVNCVLNAYRARAAMYRSRLTGDALVEARLNPEQRVDLQRALTDKGFLRSNHVDVETLDGEFGPNTRLAIKQFQQSLDARQTGFLSAEQRVALLERPEERAGRIAAEAKAKQDAVDAQAREATRIAAEEKAKEEAERYASGEGRGSRSFAAAFLELFAGAAGTGIVAADLR